MVHTSRLKGVPKEFLPFCEDNGDYYCLTRDSRVVLWSHDGLFSGSWLDLAHWIHPRSAELARCAKANSYQFSSLATGLTLRTAPGAVRSEATG